MACTATDSAAQKATCQFSVELAKPPRLKYTKFLAFGDSITFGEFGTTLSVHPMDAGIPSSYPAKLLKLLSARYTAQTVTMINAGLGGEQAEAALPRLQHELGYPTTYDVVILMEGTNDLNYYPNEEGIESAADAMDDLARECFTRRAKAVLVGKIPPMVEGGFRARCPTCVVPFNDLVAQLTAGRGASVVDVYSPLYANLRTLIGADGVHPTEAGYDVIAQTYFQAIVSLFEESPGGLPSRPSWR